MFSSHLRADDLKRWTYDEVKLCVRVKQITINGFSSFIAKSQRSTNAIYISIDTKKKKKIQDQSTEGTNLIEPKKATTTTYYSCLDSSKVVYISCNGKNPIFSISLM